MKTDPAKVEIGDLVWWASTRGRPTEAVKIKNMDLCARPGVKYGVPVNAIYRNQLATCCISLENGRWAYGYDVVPLTASETRYMESLDIAA